MDTIDSAAIYRAVIMNTVKQKINDNAMKQRIFIILFLIVSLIMFGQDYAKNENLATTPTTYQTNEVNLNNQILKYQEFLRDETKLHREYTQEYYAMILKLFSLIAVVFGAILTWLNWKSKEDIKKQINQRFQETVQKLLDDKLKTLQELSDDKLKQLDSLINENKEKSAKQFEIINKLILELSAKSDKMNEQTSQDYQEGEKANANTLIGKKILWVDDYPENNDYPREMLEQAGVEFALALETESAINILKYNKFDLIISDMGRGNNHTAGLDLLKELKKLGIKTPVVIFSHSRNKYGEEARALGAIAITSGFTNVLNVIQKELLKT